MDTDEYFPGYLPINRGIDRNQVGNVLERLRGTVLTAQPRCVVVMGGVNDLSVGTPADWIQASLRELLDAILADGANVVIVTTPNPAGGVLGPFGARRSAARPQLMDPRAGHFRRNTKFLSPTSGRLQTIWVPTSSPASRSMDITHQRLATHSSPV